MAIVYECYVCGFLGVEEEMKYSWINDGTKDYTKEDSGLCHTCKAKQDLKQEMQSETMSKGRQIEGISYPCTVGGGEKVVCPYCGSTTDPDWEDGRHYGEEGDMEWFEDECGLCGRTFEMQVMIEYTRTTRKIISNEEVEKEWESRGELISRYVD